MRVLLAIPSIAKEVGGPGYSVRRTYESLRDASVESVIATARAEPGTVAIGGLSREALSGVQLVHNFGAWTPFNHRIARIARRRGIPQVCCPMGMLEPWALGQKRLKKRLAWLAYQRRDVDTSAVVHATGEAEAEHVEALGITVPRAVIPRGIDVPSDLPHDRRRMEGTEERTILFVSRIHPKKGLLDLVEACSGLTTPASWRVIVAGTDEHGHQGIVEAAVRRASLESRFEFTGPVWGTDKPGLFARADVFVLPTYSENFGVAIGEALAHGLPVITTTGTPWKELVDLRCGWWIPTGSAALQAALRKALSIPAAELKAMGRRGRALVQERYAWTAIAAKQIELYRWVLGLGSRPDFVSVRKTPVQRTRGPSATKRMASQLER